ncbi:MAG: glycosyltransferase [Muribaculaceae bacterium]|nr:glycosyltransferase [Muribaculaceae bacterium]
MKTKVLYVLVSSENDVYLEQAYVSISSLRFHMGDNVEVNLLVDNITFAGLIGKRKLMVKEVDNIITVELDSSFSPQNKSRILKTTCRNYIKGDFFFIDCDTLITKSLAYIKVPDADIAACYDAHTLFFENPYRDMCIKHGNKIGVDFSKQNEYFNSGVLFVKESCTSYSFFENWNKNWFKGRNNGVSMDQPAFNKTNIEMGYPVKRLEEICNCQLIHGIRFLKDAIIVHYLCTNITAKDNAEPFILRDADVLYEIKEKLRLPEKVIECFTDVFKGIPNFTTLVSGKNNFIIRSDCYYLLSRLYGNSVYNLINNFCKVINRLCKKKLKKK